LKLTDCARAENRAEQVRAGERRTHTFFRNPGETQEAVQARIRAKIARGDASPDDRFVTFFWKSPDGDED
jgi:hypothetical protein